MTEVFIVKKMEQAKKLAVEQFGVSEDFIVFRVLEEKKGFFGKMKVEAIYEESVSPKTAEPSKRETKAPSIIEMDDIFAEKSNLEDTEDTKEEVNSNVEDTKETVEKEEEKYSESAEKNEESTYTEAKELSDDELPDNLKAAKTYITAIYEKMGVNVNVAVSIIENGILMNVTSESKSGIIIGRRGETLDSIQYLSSIIANRGMEEYNRIMLDSNGYRVKRRKTLEQLAEKIAKNVLRSGRSTTLEPMNPYERRIIHSKIAEIDGVVSHSVGEDPYRKVVVAVPGGQNRRNRRNNGNDGNRRPYREKRPEDFKPSNLDNMKTSFEKDYKKPRPEDELNTGLYGKIEL